MAFDKDKAKKHSVGQIYGPIQFLGQEVYVVEESARVRDELDWAAGNGQLIELRSFFVTRCTVDKDGVRIFGDADQEWIGEKPSAVLDEIYELAAKKLTAEARSMLKKKRKPQGNASSGASPRHSATRTPTSSLTS